MSLKCIECNSFCNPYIPIKSIINILNIKLPLELCHKIINYYNLTFKCSICQSIVCQTHVNNSVKYNNYYNKNYNGYICSNCLWFN